MTGAPSLPAWFVRTLLALCLVFLTGTALACVWITGYFDFTEEAIGLQSMHFRIAAQDWLFNLVLPLALAVGAGLLAIGATRAAKRLDDMRFRVIALAVAFFVQLAWVVALDCQACGYYDAKTVSELATALLSGNPGALVEGEAPYLMRYPFQSGFLLLIAGVYQVFGTGNQVAFMLLNVVANCASLLALASIAKSAFGSESVARLVLVLGLLCWPLLFLSALFYGNTLGMALAFGAVALAMRAMGSEVPKGRRLALAAGTFGLFAVALVCKSTFQLLLFASAAALLVFALRERLPSLAALTLAGTLLALQVPGVPVAALEAATNTEFGDGAPLTSWIAEGLSDESPYGEPGWYNLLVNEHFTRGEEGVQALREATSQSIETSLARFAEDPAYAGWFFSKKLASEWLDPTFESLWFSAQADSRPFSGFESHIIYGGHKAHTLAETYMKGFQMLAYFLAAGACALLLRQRHWHGPYALSLLTGTFFMGVCVYALWEAKSLYVFPFFLLLLPLCAWTLDRLFAKVAAASGGAS